MRQAEAGGEGMSTVNKAQFLKFAETLYLTKIQDCPISDDIGGWFVGIAESSDQGDYLVSVISPEEAKVSVYVTAKTMMGALGRVYDKLARPEPEERTTGPMKYENLSADLKTNMSFGYMLAAHMVADEDGLRAEHLTTVRAIGEDHRAGAPLYFCNDVCRDDCEGGSVRMLMVEMPQRPIASTQFPIDVELARADFFGGLDDDIPSTTPMERLSFLVGKAEEVAGEMADFQIAAESAIAAQDRLEKLRDWTYERYRISVRNGSTEMMKVHMIVLFFIETGLKPGEDKPLFRAFADHVSDAVVLFDADKLPGFQPESEQDCG
jgi:hypothetical protein